MGNEKPINVSRERVHAANGSYCGLEQVSGEVTLSGATEDVANIIPHGAAVLGIVLRILETITISGSGVKGFFVGDEISGSSIIPSPITTLAAGTLIGPKDYGTGIPAMLFSTANGYSGASDLRFTSTLDGSPDGAFTAGKISYTLFYFIFSEPTS